MAVVYFSLGSNLGNREQYLQHALFLLERAVGQVAKISPLYESPAWGFSSTPFYNICAELQTALSLEEVLEAVHQIEAHLGRVRSNDTQGYQARTLDIDILYYEDVVCQTPMLSVPHPQMTLRRFVLQPLCDIAPQRRHPVENKTTKELLFSCTDNARLSLVKKDISIKKMSFKNKYTYIAIEGNIGAGKTSLASLLARDFRGKLLLEEFASNPFLEDFYKDTQRYALPTELNFLKDRYKQLQEELSMQTTGVPLIADYAISKSLIFASETLQQKEYTLYEEIFYLLFERMIKPDLYVYLHQSTDALLQNIQKRGRSFETPISKTYLERIEQSYLAFLEKNTQLNTLFIDVSYMDFVKNEEDYLFICSLITA